MGYKRGTLISTGSEAMVCFTASEENFNPVINKKIQARNYGIDRGNLDLFSYNSSIQMLYK